MVALGRDSSSMMPAWSARASCCSGRRVLPRGDGRTDASVGGEEVLVVDEFGRAVRGGASSRSRSLKSLFHVFKLDLATSVRSCLAKASGTVRGIFPFKVKAAR